MTLTTTRSGPIKVGQAAPDFEALNLNDEIVNLKALIIGRKVLLVFYRGGWCPFCNQQLAAISQDYRKFLELGATIVAVSGEQVEKGKELLKKLNLPYILLSDTKFEGIDRYGMRDTDPSEATRARSVTSLSKPAAFIIDERGIVRYIYVGENAKDRPRNDDLLQVIREISPMQVNPSALDRGEEMEE